MVRYHFTTCDVFTERAFAGNRLAVFSDATAMAEYTMQAIAREFDYPETVFVVPGEHPAGHWPVRIFTPDGEVPFAGHPTIGTALTLVRLGKAEAEGDRVRLVLQEKAGAVPVDITLVDGRADLARFTAPEAFTMKGELDAMPVARALGLQSADLANAGAPVVRASCGLPFPFLELAGVEAMGRIVVDARALAAAVHPHAAEIVVFCAADGAGDADFRVRMFAPGHGITEDPATGSAAAALAGIMAMREPAASGRWRWQIDQGIEMGRPSRIGVEALKEGGSVAEICVEGRAVPMSEGWFEVDA